MISLLRAAVERGITFLDIADAYSCFVLAVEEIVLIDPCLISASILHRAQAIEDKEKEAPAIKHG